MILQFRKSILPSLGLLLFAFVGQPLWTALHGALATIPSLTNLPRPPSAPISDPAPKRSLPTSQPYGTLPIYFEPNLGQTDPAVKFIARSGGATTFLTATEAVFSLPIADFGLPNGEQSIKGGGYRDPAVWDQQPLDLSPWNFAFGHPDSRPGPTPIHGPQSAIANRQSAISMKLVGANPSSQIEGMDRLPGVSNYFIGNDPAKWRTNVPHYSKVRYRDVYHGVSLVYYGNERNLEFDFEVEPGAKPEEIMITFGGTERMNVGPGGDLIVAAGGQEIRLKRARAFQQVDGKHEEVKADYDINGRRVRFKIKPYQVARALTIDPVVEFTTLLADSTPDSVAVDSKGNLVVAGTATSLDFPWLEGSPVPVSSSPPQLFVTKLNPEGESLLFSTFLGGSNKEYGFELALDSGDNVYVAGGTRSNDFPTTPAAFQSTNRGESDVFVTKIGAAGNALLYSTLLGGSRVDSVSNITLDSSENVYLAGGTDSLDFPTTPGAFQTVYGGRNDFFVTKLSRLGSKLEYSTFLGGDAGEAGFEFSDNRQPWIGVDRSGCAYIAGSSNSDNFPVTPGALQPVRTDRLMGAVITKLNPEGSNLVYSTWVESFGRRLEPSGMALDSQGRVLLTGTMLSFGTFDGTYVLKLNASGSALAYSLFGLGGAQALVDSDDNAYILDYAGDRIIRLAPSGENPQTFLIESLYRGFIPQVSDFALGSNGVLYLTGTASSSPREGDANFQSFPTVWKGFIAKVPELASHQAELFVPIVISSSGVNNSFFTSELTLLNRGTTDAMLQLTYNAAIGEGKGVALDSLAAGKQRIITDAIAYLRDIGIPISSNGNQGGTLRIKFSGLSSPEVASATVRTTTALPNGRAGLSYAAIAADSRTVRLFKSQNGAIGKTDIGMPPKEVLTATCYLPGLQQNSANRTNVAVQNAGTEDDGDVSLRLTVISGEAQSPRSILLPEVRLSPGSFKQFDSILSSSGLGVSQGYVRVERTSGNGPYYAYAVINDQGTSDGTFITPVPELALKGESELILPAVVKAGAFETELVLTNWSSVEKQLFFELGPFSTSIPSNAFSLTLSPGQQLILPSFIQWMRQRSVPQVGPQGGDYVWALFARSQSGDMSGVFLGSRVTTPGSGGRLGVAYPAVPYDQTSANSTWIYGMQQNGTNRTNLAIVNTGGVDRIYHYIFHDLFRIELFDGETGLKVNTLDEIEINPGEWKQFNGILAQYAPGTTQAYARVSRLTGFLRTHNPFIVYGVINDGGAPGERTGDGAFIGSSP